MICKNCGKKIGLCGNCYNAFNEGDKIICDIKNGNHFSSIRCASLFYKHQFVLSNVVGDKKWMKKR